MTNSKKKEEKKQPAPWKPIDIKKFNENTKTISKIFKLDPERTKEDQENDNNNGDNV